MQLESHGFSEKRVDARIPVFHRTRAVGPGGQPLSLVIVDLSASGLMARCDVVLPAGSPIQITLPAIGVHSAVVRWSLGGRMGCELDEPISLENYYELLTALAREA
ncbi:MAG: pilus assembly protein PilZ [Sphingomonas bacterium]|uniref:PilZ domain-containing protein n=1 Tax=Sphingomonas bacterium TaxID=1895847 RepID=UPI00260D5846|nr:PilZ domain-containing protein [Sphingomonas bacterium]MDB5706882.1 pilus assembly protein PilZ [Sphingomonas bacterium]